MPAPPRNINVLLMEGTNLGSDKPCITESDLELGLCPEKKASGGEVLFTESRRLRSWVLAMSRPARRLRRCRVNACRQSTQVTGLSEAGALLDHAARRNVTMWHYRKVLFELSLTLSAHLLCLAEMLQCQSGSVSALAFPGVACSALFSEA